MRVISTAGHVNHGKSTLVRSLTGEDPDRLPDERRRGMTVDLGFASLALPSGDDLAIVDVPGHSRYLANMVGGIATAPAVLFVVAADGGWEPQSAEHLAAVRAFGIDRGVLAVTRSDLADPIPATIDATRHLRDAGIDAPAVAVSARTGHGRDELLEAIDAVTVAPPDTGPPRLWVDRVFTRPGAGTVVTGTLRGGTIRLEDRLIIAPTGVGAEIRGLQLLGSTVAKATGPARVAVSLRRISPSDITRGQALVEADRWRITTTIDVYAPDADDDLPRELIVLCGTAVTAARVRPLDGQRYRLQMKTGLPLHHGDRLLLNDTGPRRLLSAHVLDADPPTLRRRGDAAAWAKRLADTSHPVDLLRRRGLARRADLTAAGCSPSADAIDANEWVIDPNHAADLGARLTELAHQHTMPIAEAARTLAVPEPVVTALAMREALAIDGGVIAESSMSSEERRVLNAILGDLNDTPFAAPTAARLTDIGADRDVLAALTRRRMLWHGGGPIYLAPDAPTRAAERLSAIDGPFTIGDAARVLGTTRRVALPLLERLQQLGRTRRTDDGRHVFIAAT